jgi:hypothetical protein
MKSQISALSSKVAQDEIDSDNCIDVTVHDALGIEYTFRMEPRDGGALRVTCLEGPVTIEPVMGNVVVLIPKP